MQQSVSGLNPQLLSLKIAALAVCERICFKFAYMASCTSSTHHYSIFKENVY